MAQSFLREREQDICYNVLLVLLISMTNNLRSLVMDVCGFDALYGLMWGGVQFTYAEGGAYREPHVDTRRIAGLLLTITLGGDGVVGIHPLQGQGTLAEVPQATGEAYALHGPDGLVRVRHSVLAGPAGRWSATFRFVDVTDVRD